MPNIAKIVIAIWSLLVLNNVVVLVMIGINDGPQALLGPSIPVLITGWVLKGLLERSNNARRSVRAIAFLIALVTGLVCVGYIAMPEIPVEPNVRIKYILLLAIACAVFSTMTVAMSNKTATDWFCE